MGNNGTPKVTECDSSSQSVRYRFKREAIYTLDKIRK